jgi:hypothetical protein
VIPWQGRPPLAVDAARVSEEAPELIVTPMRKAADATITRGIAELDMG